MNTSKFCVWQGGAKCLVTIRCWSRQRGPLTRRGGRTRRRHGETVRSLPAVEVKQINLYRSKQQSLVMHNPVIQKYLKTTWEERKKKNNNKKQLVFLIVIKVSGRSSYMYNIQDKDIGRHQCTLKPIKKTRDTGQIHGIWDVNLNSLHQEPGGSFGNTNQPTIW